MCSKQTRLIRAGTWDRVMVTVTVRYHNILRLRAGLECESLDLPEGADVSVAVRQLAGRHGPGLEEMLLSPTGRGLTWVSAFVCSHLSEPFSDPAQSMQLKQMGTQKKSKWRGRPRSPARTARPSTLQPICIASRPIITGEDDADALNSRRLRPTHPCFAKARPRGYQGLRLPRYRDPDWTRL